MITAGRSGAVAAYVAGYIGVTVAPVCSVPRVAIRVGVFGAGGRMGATVCEAVAGDPALELVAAVDPSYEGQPSTEGVTIAAAPRAMADANAQVAVDFTAPEAAMGNLRWCAMHEMHAVVGTTGLGEPELDELRHLFTASNCIVAPNFAIGAVLLMEASQTIARHLPECEIVELHHDRKLDAPSGTAKRTAELIEAAGGNVHEPIHSVRLPGLVAHQEVIFGGEGQTLSLRHDSIDRRSFMPGVLLAVRRVGGLQDRFTVGLEKLL